MPAGRPASFQWTKELEQAIVDRLLTRSLRQICREDKDIPDRVTIQRYMAANEDFATKCARARQEHARFRLEAVEEDVDTITPENAKAVQVKVGFAQWLAGRLLSKEYGDKMEHNVEIGIRTVIVPAPAKDSSPRPESKPMFDPE